MHQLLVAGHVNEAQHVAIGQRRIGIAEFDGNAARFLFLEPVGVDASQGAHQRGLAVVDMAGGADDHARGSASCAAKAASSRASRQRRASHKAASAMRPMTGVGRRRNCASSLSKWRPGRPLPG
ncbi:hypothetical protein G6F57_022060 [Rhizopus arrhizus]|nr:hypothetical protein G6F57_022060 [Rhizopus arrhizus]